MLTEEDMVEVLLDDTHINASQVKIKQALSDIKAQLAILKDNVNNLCVENIDEQVRLLINADFSLAWTHEIIELTTLPDNPSIPFLFKEEVDQYIICHNQLVEYNQITRHVAPIFRQYRILSQFAEPSSSHNQLNQNSWQHLQRLVEDTAQKLNSALSMTHHYETLHDKIQELSTCLESLGNNIQLCYKQSLEKTDESPAPLTKSNSLNRLIDSVKTLLKPTSVFGEPVDGAFITLDMQKSFIFELLESFKALKSPEAPPKSSSSACGRMIWSDPYPEVTNEKTYLYPVIEKLESILSEADNQEKAGVLHQYDFFTAAIDHISQSLESWGLLGENARVANISLKNAESDGGDTTIESAICRMAQAIESKLDFMPVFEHANEKGYLKKYGHYDPSKEYIYQYVNRMVAYLKDFATVYLGYQRHEKLTGIRPVLSATKQDSHFAHMSSSSAM